MSFELDPSREARFQTILTRYAKSRAACIPLLALCQEQAGWISPEVVDYAARKLNLTTAEVKGVATFYTSLHQRPMAPNVVWVCRTLSCELRGAGLIQECLEELLGCKTGETSANGKFTLLKAECLAACGEAPMIQVNDQYYERLTPEALAKLIDELDRKTAPGQVAAIGGAVAPDVALSDVRLRKAGGI